MTVPDTTTRRLANSAGRLPYEQSRSLTVSNFSAFLRRRDISLPPWALTWLAMQGVVRPLAWEPCEFVRTDPGRFVLTPEEDGPWRLYADRGPTADTFAFSPTPSGFSRPDATYPETYWHPFHLWLCVRVHDLLRLPIANSQALHGTEATQRLAGELASHTPTLLNRFAESDEATEFYGVLAVLIAVEPLVVGRITGSRSYQPLQDETPEAFANWAAEFDHSGLLSATGLTVSRLRWWHSELATRAEIVDPIRAWRELVRLSTRRAREDFRGLALLAGDLYYAAEVIRRYLEVFHDVSDMPDEDDLMYGPAAQRVKREWYGSETTTGQSRSVFRNVVRRFDLDPQPRMRWLIEGQTEEAFVRRYFEVLQVDLDFAGIQLINTNGAGSLESGDVIQLLRMSRDEEVFVQITVDDDGRAERVRQLRRLAKDGFVPAGWAVYSPNFVAESFTDSELADAVWRAAAATGLKTGPTSETIRELRASPAELETVLARWVRAHGGILKKGRLWGEALADALLNSTENVLERRVTRFLSMAARAKSSNYRFTVLGTVVNEDGMVVDARRSND